MQQAMHFASHTGDMQYVAVIEGNAHRDIASYLIEQGFTVTCLDEIAQKYRIEWR